MTTAPNELAAAASRYASTYDWAVFPVHSIRDGACTCSQVDCGSPGKHPRTPRGLTDATKDQQVIKEWWQQWPEANIGVRTGQASGIMAVDLDVKDEDVNGITNWYDLLDAHGSASTMTAFTGSGGQHWIYKLPTDCEVRNDAGTKLAKGIDIRGDGGYIVVAPSIHLSGATYEWEDNSPAVLAPEWLISKCASPVVKAPAAAVQRPVGDYEPWVTTALEGVGESYRNQTATRLVGYFHKSGVAEDIIYAILTPFAEACTPAMDTRELRQIGRASCRERV